LQRKLADRRLQRRHVDERPHLLMGRSVCGGCAREVER
jgi:hypothetical protein